MGLFDFLFNSGKKTASRGPRVNVARRFDLQSRSGHGSMSAVWRAYDRTLGRTVCLKLLDIKKTAAFEARFVGKNKPPEGDICMALSHRNIVRTYEWGYTTKKETYLVMEWIDGLGLNFLVETRSNKLTGSEKTYLAQIADALEYMHRERYLHRDLCPRNVMVTAENAVKLIDFGLTIPYRPEFCVPGNRTGTPDYLAPEIIKRQSSDHRVDLFSIGVTAYEMYTGGLPWPKAGGSLDMLQKHINQPARDPHEFNPNLPPDVRAFLLKAVAREPRERYQTAAEFKDAVTSLPD